MCAWFAVQVDGATDETSNEGSDVNDDDDDWINALTCDISLGVHQEVADPFHCGPCFFTVQIKIEFGSF